MIHINISKQTFRFNAKRAATSLAASRSDSAYEPVVERAMITAVGRLFAMESPSRRFSTSFNFAPCFEVDHRAAHDIALMAEACGGRIVCQESPPRLHTAGVMRANLAANVNHTVVSMSLAVFGHLAALVVKGRLACAGVT